MAERGQRADLYLAEHGYAASRAEAQAAIRAGLVEVDGRKLSKPSQTIAPGAAIRYQPPHPYVSRGGVKLAAALDRFGLSPAGCICLDVGASTGGFTEVLLQRGASRVYAVDVGHGQLHVKIASHPRVTSIEGVNARELSRAQIPELLGCVVADVSFISLKLALPQALALAVPGAWAVLLVKPQFEAGREAIASGGIVRDPAARLAALDGIAAWMETQGWRVVGTMESPIEGGDGNREFLLAARKAE